MTNALVNPAHARIPGGPLFSNTRRSMLRTLGFLAQQSNVIAVRCAPLGPVCRHDLRSCLTTIHAMYNVRVFLARVQANG